jgi:hypothetical protein
VGDYIGDSTRAEIAYARNLGKLVRFTHPQVDPDREAPTAAPHEIRTGGAPTAPRRHRPPSMAYRPNSLVL